MELMHDFKSWLLSVDTESFDEVHSLYNSVLNIEEWGCFSCTERPIKGGKQYFIKCSYIEEPLLLASVKAKDYFLEYIETNYAGDLGIEGEYAFRRAMQKED